MNEPQTAAQINAPQTGETGFTPVPDGPVAGAHGVTRPTPLPKPAVEPHPLRKGIVDMRHTIPELKAFVAAADLHPGLKDYLADELDALAASGRGFDLHISLAPMQLGAGPGINAGVLHLHDVLKSPVRAAGGKVITGARLTVGKIETQI